MNTIAAKIKSILTGEPVEEEKPKAKRNPCPNGPVTFKTMTNGQVRRQAQRAKKSKQDKAFLAQRRGYIAQRAEESVLRGMLQVLGYIPYVEPTTLTLGRLMDAEKWVNEKYGDAEKAVARYEALTGEKITS